MNTKLFCWVVSICIIFGSGSAGYAAEAPQAATKAAPEAMVKAEEPEPTNTYLSKALDQLGCGVSDIVYAPFEVPYRWKDEITMTDPIQGVLPGLIKGVSWAVAREAIGIYEVVTFFAPSGPYIERFNTDWLHA